MARRTIGAVAALTVLAVGAVAARAEGPAAVGTVVAVSGTVQLRSDGPWQAAVAAQRVFEGQFIQTGAASSAEILFDPDVPIRVGEKTQIAVADLLLKARLEKAKAKVAAPGSDAKVELQVTPLTGVRGTEKSEEKAEDLKREHYWNEGAPAAK